MSTLYCPKCGYNLTGLTEERCPECGAGFDPLELARLQVLTTRRAKHAVFRAVLMPIAFAFVAPFMATVFTSWTTHFSPSWLVILLVLLGVMAAFALPVWHGTSIGKNVALSKRYRRDGSERSSPKPVWYYVILFALLECGLMTVYMTVPALLIIYLATK